MAEAAAEIPEIDSSSLYFGATDKADPSGAAEELAVTDGSPPEGESLEQGDGDEPKSEAEGADDGASDEGEELYYELDGKEHSLAEMREYRDGNIRLKTFTQKTTAVAREREAVAAQREELTSELSELASLKAEMQALIAEDSEVDWKELRDKDPDEYIELKERADKRKAAAKKVKTAPSVKPLSQDEVIKEQKLLFAANPGWLDDKGAPTEEMEADKILIGTYWRDNGFTDEETGGASRSRHVQVCLKAAKYDALMAKAKKSAKKAKAATLVTKPKGNTGKLKQKQQPREDLYFKPVTE